MWSIFKLLQGTFGDKVQRFFYDQKQASGQCRELGNQGTVSSQMSGVTEVLRGVSSGESMSTSRHSVIQSHTAGWKAEVVLEPLRESAFGD